jgi:F-type H+-transporting ATPase subunit a
LIIGFRRHGIKLFGMLLPGGTPLAMVPFLVVLELIAFCVTLVSLSVRLFANMIAGHILLNVFAGFAFSILSLGGLF